MLKSTWRVHGTADFGPRRLVLGLVRPALCVCAMVVGALRALVVVLVTSLVSELHSAQHGTSAGEYNVVIDAKVEGDQWKEIMNQAQTNETIGQGLQTNVSKVKQMLTETDRGCSQRAESCVIVAQSFDAFLINETTDIVLPDAIRTSTSRLVPVGLYVIMVLAHAMFAFSCKLHVMIFESAMKRPIISAPVVIVTALMIGFSGLLSLGVSITEYIAALGWFYSITIPLHYFKKGLWLTTRRPRDGVACSAMGEC